MAVDAATAAKGLAGLSIFGCGASAAYMIYAQSRNAALALGRYDRALIDFLDGESHDIVFEVKRGAENISDTDPSFASEAPANITVKVQITVPASSDPNSPLRISGSPAAADKVAALTSLNSGAPWTWSCSFDFSREAGSSRTALVPTLQRRLINSSKQGLFPLLKRDFSGQTASEAGKWSREEAKDAKRKFIHRCAGARRALLPDKTAEETISSNALSHTVSDLKLRDSGAETGLIPSDSAAFDVWFMELYGTKSTPS